MTSTAIRLTGPGDLLAVVPHLFGFTPTQSIVAIELTPTTPQRLGFMARLDLPDEGHLEDAAEAVTSPMLRHGVGPGDRPEVAFTGVRGQDLLPCRGAAAPDAREPSSSDDDRDRLRATQ